MQTSKTAQIGNSSFAAADWMVRVSATLIGYIESRTFASMMDHVCLIRNRQSSLGLWSLFASMIFADCALQKVYKVTITPSTFYFELSFSLSISISQNDLLSLQDHIFSFRLQFTTMAPVTRTLGKDGPSVPVVGFGLMSIGGVYGAAPSDEERTALLDHAHAIGERFWDTADIYADSEDAVGLWVKQNPEKRKDIFLATKFGIQFDRATYAQTLRSDPEYVKEACERSLKRLNTDYIDLYYCHRVDGKTPIEKTVEAMVELKKYGFSI